MAVAGAGELGGMKGSRPRSRALLLAATISNFLLTTYCCTGTASSGGWVHVKHKLTGSADNLRHFIAFGNSPSTTMVLLSTISGLVITRQFHGPLFMHSRLCGSGNNEKVEVVLENLGSTPVSGYTLSYTVDNGSTHFQSVNAGTVPALAPNTPSSSSRWHQRGYWQLHHYGNYYQPDDWDTSQQQHTYSLGNAYYTALHQT